MYVKRFGISIIFVIVVLSVIFMKKSSTDGDDKKLEQIDHNAVEKTEVVEELFDPETQIANQKSKAFLTYFQISLDGIEVSKISQENGIKKVTVDMYELQFNEKGDVINVTTNKPYPEMKEADEYDYSTQEILQPVIDTISETLGLETYKLVTCHNQLRGSWYLVFNKVLENDIINPFDAVFLTLSAEDVSIISFSRNKVEPENTDIKMISREKAVENAKPIIEKFKEYEQTSVELRVVKPNYRWEENKRTVNYVRIAWEITLVKKSKWSKDDEVVIWIDAEMGEILGGDEKSYF